MPGAAHRADDELVAVGRARRRPARSGVATRRLVAGAAPDVIIHAAARVGGHRRQVAHPPVYLQENLLIDTSGASGRRWTPRGPRVALRLQRRGLPRRAHPQPIVEVAFLSGPLEGAERGLRDRQDRRIKLCEYAIPRARPRLPGDPPVEPVRRRTTGSIPASAHLVAADDRQDAAGPRGETREVEVWGDGTARREFTFAGDLAEWIVGQSASSPSGRQS